MFRAATCLLLLRRTTLRLILHVLWWIVRVTCAEQRGHISLGSGDGLLNFCTCACWESLSPPGESTRAGPSEPAPLPPQADTWYVNPRFIAVPGPYDPRGTEEEVPGAEPFAGGAVFNQQHTGSASSLRTHSGYGPAALSRRRRARWTAFCTPASQNPEPQ